jgi:hypothetical protein
VSGRLRGAALAPVARTACVALAGCALLLPVPDMRTPLDRARGLSDLCKRVHEEDMAALLAPGAIDTVEPAYANVHSGAAELESRLRGARIRLMPTPGMSSEGLTRSVECHEARVTLGEVVAGADDPYVLPGTWLDLDASSARDSFVILVTVDDFEAARQVLERARRFVAHSATP